MAKPTKTQTANKTYPISASSVALVADAWNALQETTKAHQAATDTFNTLEKALRAETGAPANFIINIKPDGQGAFEEPQKEEAE